MDDLRKEINENNGNLTVSGHKRFPHDNGYLYYKNNPYIVNDKTKF
jgi:hypothetical protein